MIQLLILFFIFGAIGDLARYVIAKVRYPKEPYKHCPSCGTVLATSKSCTSCNWKHPKKPTPPWGAIILLSLCSLPVLFGAYINSDSPPVPTHKVVPTVTKQSAVFTQDAFYHPTVTDETCFHWDSINATMKGQNVCVYGVVTDYKENWENKLSNFYFGEWDKFFLVSTNRWNESPEGRCISATGEIQLNTYKTPYMKIDEFYYCK